MKTYIIKIALGLIFCMVLLSAAQGFADEAESADDSTVWGVTYDKCSHLFTVIKGELEGVEDGCLVINWLALYRGETECTLTEIPYEHISRSKDEALAQAERLNGNHLHKKNAI